MKQYKTDRAIVNGYLRAQPDADTSRSHAMNWAAGVALLALCGYVVVWSLIKIFWEALPNWTILLCVPVAIISGISWGSMKLISYTEMHRAYLYGLESVLGIDINGDGNIGEPDVMNRGALLYSIDDTYKRIDTTLSMEEIDQIKRLLLLSKKATVRSLAAIIGYRASQFRTELIGLGICEKPENSNAAAVLSEAGERAVLRW